MQAVKKAAVSVKETAENIAASAFSGMIKTKAVVQEKVDKMKAKNSSEKRIAEERKVQKMKDAETIKRVALEQHAAAKEATHGDGREQHRGQVPGETPASAQPTLDG